MILLKNLSHGIENVNVNLKENETLHFISNNDFEIF